MRKVPEKQRLAKERLESVEWYLFFFGGSLLWYLAVTYILDYMQFPYHLHKTEVLCIYTVPMLLIVIILNLIEYFVGVKND